MQDRDDIYTKPRQDRDMTNATDVEMLVGRSAGCRIIVFNVPKMPDQV